MKLIITSTNNKIKLAIVGSRNYEEFCLILNDFLKKYLQESDKLECIVSDGAKVADSLAERYARENFILTLIFNSYWAKYGKAADPVRNSDIISNSAHVLAFPSRYKSGTQNTISRAQKANLPSAIYYVD